LERKFTTILRGTIGSGAHGLAIEGTDDHDEMGVVVESYGDAISIGSPFEHYIYRTATERNGKEGTRSMPGDLDLTLYSLQKYLRLALGGNPSVLIPLYLRGDLLTLCTSEGKELQDLAPKIISKKAIRAFYHYLRAQKGKLSGEKGTRVHRPELVEKYGYDTKFAMHALRLGMQGLELARGHTLSLPMLPSTREFLLEVRTGYYKLDFILGYIDHLEEKLLRWTELTALPDEPDTKAVEEWMRDVYWATWSEERSGMIV
jgi:predicted nucleotidyltransferase